MEELVLLSIIFYLLVEQPDEQRIGPDLAEVSLRLFKQRAAHCKSRIARHAAEFRPCIARTFYTRIFESVFKPVVDAPTGLVSTPAESLPIIFTDSDA